MKERQVRILEKITKNVGLQVGLHQNVATSDVTPVANPYNDTLEDLSDSDVSEKVSWPPTCHTMSIEPETRRTTSIEPETPPRNKVRFSIKLHLTPN